MVSPPVPQTGYGGFDSPQAHDDRRRRRSSGPVDVGYRNYNGPKVATLGRPSQRSAGRTSPKVAGACQRPTSLTSSVRTPPTSRPRHRSRWRLARNPYLRPSGGRVHLPLSRGWDTTLRTSLAKVRVLPVVPRAQPATARDVHALHRLAPGWASKTHDAGFDSLAVCDRDASTPAPASASPSDAEPRFPGGVPTISTQRPRARTSGSYPLRGGLDSLRCDLSGCPSVPPRPATGRTWTRPAGSRRPHAGVV